MGEAELVGDDLYARWQSLTNTAKVLSTGSEPERAYRLFQIAEELDRAHDRVHTAKLAERLREMHEPTYFTAASRARDRRTLSFNAMITPGFQAAAGGTRERPHLLALYAFEPQSGWQTAVARLSPASRALANRVFQDFTRYERVPGEVPEESAERPGIIGRQMKEPPIDLATHFAAADFTTEDAWNDSLSELAWRSGERRDLVEFALDKHPNRRPEVLDAVGSATRATEADFANLAQAASRRPSTPGLKRAREQLGITMATRFARNICARGYDDSTLVTIAEATGTTVAKLTLIASEELGRTAHELSYHEYFHLAAHLASTLPTASAGEVFDALANLFEDLAPSSTSSDGAFESLPSPPPDSPSCVAGLVWTALGDMAAELRWQAAHAVLLLVRLGCKDELDALARFARGTEALAPFHDARFPVYTLHSRMWLLLALARAAKEPNADLVIEFTSWLIDVVRGPHHAANQVLAQRTLADLSGRGLVALEDADVLTERLVAEWVEIEYRDRNARPNPLAHAEDSGDDELERHRFFFDFEHYWCDEVARIFGSTEKDVAHRAAQVATSMDGYDLFAAGQDPRSSAGVYEQGRYHPDHSSWPAQDTQSFYLAVHALLTVGAELAATATAAKEPESAQDSYSDWLARFLPNRRDGRWLADRRDHPPVPAPETALATQVPKSGWPWTLSRRDFAIVAGVGRDWVTAGAFIESAHGELSEDTSVSSALVPHETARSLLVALQTSPSGPFSFGMPIAGEHHDRADEYPFQIDPWLDKTENHRGIDMSDERAAGVRFPPTGPGEEIIARFNLTTDDNQRVWFHDGVPVFRSRVWSNMNPGHRDREVGTKGERLEVSFKFLKSFLQEIDRTLILQVGLRRTMDRPYYERREDTKDEFDWLEWSGMFYLIDPSGHWLEY